jgi:hypothetical protein
VPSKTGSATEVDLNCKGSGFKREDTIAMGMDVGEMILVIGLQSDLEDCKDRLSHNRNTLSKGGQHLY